MNERRAITYFNFNFKSLSGQVVPINYYKVFIFFDDRYMFTSIVHIVITITFFGLKPVNTFQV